MKHNIKKLNSIQADLTVELEKDELKKYVDRAESELGKDLRIDGFRKGKVPKDLLKSNIDPQRVLQVALDLALKESLSKIIKSQDLDVLSTANLELKENNPEKLVYKVQLTLCPEIKTQDFSGIKVLRRDVEVEQKDIDETLDKIKASRAVFSDKEGPAHKGDRVEVDFEVRQDDKILEGGISKNHPSILGGKNFIPGFEDNIEGMESGEEKTFSLVAPKDYYVKSVAGKKLDFKVKLNNVKSVQLPELDDSFAVSLGKFKNLEQLRDSIKGGLKEEKQLKEKQRVRLEILNSIVKKAAITVPELLVNQQLDTMIGNFDTDLHTSGMEIGPYLVQMGKNQDDLKREWRSEAEKQVKISLILHKIAKDRNVSASQEEVDDSLSAIVQSMVARGEIDKTSLSLEALRDNVTARIVNEKTLQWLEDNYSTDSA